MHLDYNEFENLRKEIKKVFVLHTEKINDFKQILANNRQRPDQQY